MGTLHGYLAFPTYLDELKRELKLAGYKPKKMETHGDLVLIDGPRKKPIWARNIWSSVERIHFESVSEAVQRLKALGLRWVMLPHLHHRRAQLIAQGLRTATLRPLEFPKDSLPTKALGSFTLIAPNELLASAQCSQTVPNGEITFLEDKTLPPTRAYLKLWEAFTRIGKMPKAGDFCIDLGSAPGGWTWVIAKLGTQVVSVDRSEIEPTIKNLPQVQFLQTNAFTLDPANFDRMDWIFSDVICEPQKLLGLVQSWLLAFPNAHFLCSVKFKGETDFKTLNALSRIPGSTILHLNHNKHEVTWFRLGI